MAGRCTLLFSALSGFFYVLLGAFSGHYLKGKLTPAELDWIHTGLTYQGFHTVVLLVIALLMRNTRHCGFKSSRALFKSE